MIPIKEFMVHDVRTIKEDDTVEMAAKEMITKSISCLVVVRGKQPCGIITETDILKKVLLSGKNPKKTQVKAAQSKLETISPQKDFFDVVAMMQKTGAKRVAVVESEKLFGIVTQTDIVKASLKLQEPLVDDPKKATVKAKAMIAKMSDATLGVKKCVDSGYKALNAVLGGGFPSNKSILLEGLPGSGKGVVAFTYMKRGLELGENVVYICMNELVDDIREVFASLGMNVATYEKAGTFSLINMYDEVIGDTQHIYNEAEQLQVKEFGIIRETVDSLAGARARPLRVVVNFITQSMVIHDPRQVYKFVLMLNNFLKAKGATVLYFMHMGDGQSRDVVAMEEIMDGALEFSVHEDGRKSMVIKKMKPTINEVPQYFSYNLDRKAALTIKPEKHMQRG
ncbi:TPA: CBS domain-containing protein [Candidatus Woesearchaeota archaeon]|nr:CBS domain-containing protein [Candidatus Woesearchaeota archaeon]